MTTTYTSTSSDAELLLLDDLLRRVRLVETALGAGHLGKAVTLDGQIATLKALTARVAGLEERLQEVNDLISRAERLEQTVAAGLARVDQRLREVHAASAVVLEHLNGPVLRKLLVVRDGNGNITGTVESR